MSINKIEYGSLASSELLNQNFDFLINELYLTNEYINSINSTLLTNISTLNSNLSSQLKSNKENIDTSLADITQNLEAVRKMSVIDNYTNGTSGYRIFSDGFCEQWGITPASGNPSNHSIIFLKTMKDTNYFVGGSQTYDQTAGDKCSTWSIQNKTTTGMTIRTRFEQYWGAVVFWKVCGYLAEGEY